jgi:hypothetical protein
LVRTTRRTRSKMLYELKYTVDHPRIEKEGSLHTRIVARPGDVVIANNGLRYSIVLVAHRTTDPTPYLLLDLE